MRIIFVRHGHPNYELDCLTELGHQHAEAAAERLAEEPVSQIHSSTCGRAAETAMHIAARHGLPVIQHDFMREISWGSVDGEPIYRDGQPWFTADKVVDLQKNLLDPDWMADEMYARNILISYVRQVGDDFDNWLTGFGLRREGKYYRVEQGSDETIMMVSHAGSSGAVLSRLLNLPFPFVCKVMSPDFTGIHVLEFSAQTGALVSPRVALLNDDRHMQHLKIEIFYGK